MLSFEQMNIYDVLVPSGAGENRIVQLPSVRKAGGGNGTRLGCLTVPVGCSRPPTPANWSLKSMKVWTTSGW